jgi:hypothetical protein
VDTKDHNIDPANTMTKCNSYDTCSETTKQERVVSFGSIQVREYERILESSHSDVPMALAIGWKYNQHRDTDVSSWETTDYLTIVMRAGRSTRMSPALHTERFHLLKRYGFQSRKIMEFERTRIQNPTGDEKGQDEKPRRQGYFRHMVCWRRRKAAADRIQSIASTTKVDCLKVPSFGVAT